MLLVQVVLELEVFLNSFWMGLLISSRKDERSLVSWLSSEHRDNSSQEEEEEEEEEEVSLWLFLLVGLGRGGRLDLMGDRRTLCGEGTSRLNEEGGITPSPAVSSSRQIYPGSHWSSSCVTALLLVERSLIP